MGVIDYLGDNAKQIDAQEYEATVRDKDPHLLQHDEHLVFAFHGRGGSGRDHYMFTTKRVLLRDRKGVTGKRVRYTSVPYDAVRAFSLETAGSVDTDQELKIYSRSIGKVSIDLVNSVDLLPIQQFLSAVVLQGKAAGEAAAARIHDGSATMSGGKTGVFDVVGSNYAQIDKQEVEARLKSDPNILLPEEKVELAFKCGRDSFILTSHRVLSIDVQGMSGKKIEYHTILWPAICAFSIETAGNIMDRDSTLVIFFHLPDSHCGAEGFPQNSKTRMSIDFRDGQADLFAVQRYFSDKLLGPDDVESSQYASAGPSGDAGSGSALAWMGDDNRMVDAAEADRQFHSEVPLLQDCEHVELAFRGRRDMMIFTTKRLVFVDMQGFMGMGKKVEYLSVPWKTVTAFSVRSAGSWVDKDSEMCLWLDFDDVYNPVRQNEDDPQPPPIPRKSYLEVDFQKDRVDTLMVHRYLSERLMRVNGHELRPYTDPVAPDALVPSPPGAAEKLFDWIGDNAAAIDPQAADEKLHEAQVLQHDEHVAFAFNCGRDSLYLTNKRMFLIDVQGFTGKKKEYMSVPMDIIRSWSVESAGNFDRDMELRLHFKGSWNTDVKQDLRKGKADIFAIQRHIANFIIGDADGETALANAQAYEPSDPGVITTFLGFLNDAHMKDPAELTATLRSDPALLQHDESIDAAFKCGRDLFLLSTKRIIVIDKKGISGKSVEYKSYPLMYNKAFRIETEGHMMSGSEVTVYTGDDDVELELAKGQLDKIWAIHEILSDKMLNDPQKEIGEAEIAL